MESPQRRTGYKGRLGGSKPPPYGLRFTVLPVGTPLPGRPKALPSGLAYRKSEPAHCKKCKKLLISHPLLHDPPLSYTAVERGFAYAATVQNLVEGELFLLPI